MCTQLQMFKAHSNVQYVTRIKSMYTILITSNDIKNLKKYKNSLLITLRNIQVSGFPTDLSGDQWNKMKNR